MIIRNTYRVADLDFCIEFPNERIPERLSNYSPFIIDSGDTAPVFTLRFCDKLLPEGMTPVQMPDDINPEEPRIDIYRTPEGGWFFEMYPTGTAPLSGRMLISADFSEALLDSTNTFAINNALMITYALRGAREGVIEMHSSTVVNDGLAYMFLGVSGTGKSTHSRLWMENIPGTWLLNDDNPVIRVKDGKIKVYGTPWSGKTPCYKNKSAFIGAIVNLHQAKKNVISRQTPFEGYISVFSSCSGLKFDGSFLDLLHENISSVVTSIPCFDLDCLPDGDAALTCHSAAAPSVSMAASTVEIPNEILLREVENLLSEGNEVVLLTKGNSMLPTINGERDSVKLKKSDTYNNGDVVLARVSPKQYVLHRILSIDSEKVVLKGDGNLRGTEVCGITDICGKVEALVTGGKEKPISSATLWNRLPYIFRRVLLAIFVRLQ